MSSALTEFGVKCRALRSTRGMLMVDQARAMKLSSAFISAVETGVKSIPSDYVGRLAEWLKLSATESQEVQKAASVPRIVKVRPKDGETAKLVAEFAASIEKLTKRQIRELRLIINNGAN
jgi:HTH-type transcriptional regulator, competence development regulator